MKKLLIGLVSLALISASAVMAADHCAADGKKAKCPCASCGENAQCDKGCKLSCYEKTDKACTKDDKSCGKDDKSCSREDKSCGKKEKAAQPSPSAESKK